MKAPEDTGGYTDPNNATLNANALPNANSSKGAVSMTTDTGTVSGPPFELFDSFNTPKKRIEEITVGDVHKAVQKGFLNTGHSWWHTEEQIFTVFVHDKIKKLQE